MKVVVELNASDFKKYDSELLTQIAQETITSSGFFAHADTDTVITISVAVVNEAEIQRVNKQLRNKDAVTDVISIGDYSDECDVASIGDREIFLGEVILCYNYIEQSAQENDISVDKEFFTVYSHGILHLLGFQHGDNMFELQDSVASKFCNS